MAPQFTTIEGRLTTGGSRPVLAPQRIGEDNREALSIARAEALRMAAGEDLASDGKVQEHRRHQTFRNHVNKAAIGIFWGLAISLYVGIAAFSWHLVAPEALHFLSENQLEKLQTVLGSAILSSALTGYVNRRLA